MPIVVNLDVMMAKRKMSLNELSEKMNLTLANLSILKTGKAKAVQFSTLEAICKAPDCQPGIYWSMYLVKVKLQTIPGAGVLAQPPLPYCIYFCVPMATFL